MGMDPDNIRRALLSMIRGGGVLAVNLLVFGAGTDVNELAEPFDAIRPGLFESLLNRQLLLPDPEDPHRQPMFYSLVDRERDGALFELSSFSDDRVASFKFAVLTSSDMPHEELCDRFDVMRVTPMGRPAASA